jgi:hypothetical protein
MKGEVRNPIMMFLFAWLSCGLYNLYFTHKAASELKAYLGNEDVNPMVITVISLLTCHFWGGFQVGKLIMEAQQRAGVPNPVDKGLIAGVLNMFTCITGFGNKLLQDELNKVWETGGGAPATF